MSEANSEDRMLEVEVLCLMQAVQEIEEEIGEMSAHQKAGVITIIAFTYVGLAAARKNGGCDPAPEGHSIQLRGKYTEMGKKAEAGKE